VSSTARSSRRSRAGSAITSYPATRPRRLVSRFALGHRLAASDRGTHYTGGAHGYVDYPIWPAAAAGHRLSAEGASCPAAAPVSSSAGSDCPIP
jgi:hypothetical protein